MKKTLLVALALIPLATFAQTGTDTLIWADFNTDPSGMLNVGAPPAILWDTAWYNLDNDLLPDGSGGSRPPEWHWSAAFSYYDTTGNPGVLASNSWTNDVVNSVDNWLILPSIFIADTSADLFWKSAPLQTPRYLDGYMIVVSSGSNDIQQFTDTIFVAAEFTSLNNQGAPNSFASYTFTPASGFIHGSDGMYAEFNPAADSSTLIGKLRPFQADLSQYVGQNIYIAFVHHSTDDNMISVDDIFVEGTDLTASIDPNNNVSSMGFYPNPANDILNVNFTLVNEAPIVLNIYSIDGSLVRSENRGTANSGSGTLQTNISDLAAGVYVVQLQTATGVSSKRIVVE